MEDSEVHRLLEGQIADAGEKNGRKVYNVVGREEEQQEEQEKKNIFRLFSIGHRHPTDPPTPPPGTRCVLLLGETGAGKTTFISAVFNYLFGVNFDDPFRLQIEENFEDGRRDVDSRTDVINVYTVHYQEGMKHEYNVVLIDTPGLADTRGTEQQQIFMENLHTLFKSDFGVDDLHCLGIVAKGNTNRILGFQKDLLGEIHLVLGKYIPGISNVFATFALETVSVDAVVKASGVPFQKTFRFDNGCLFCPTETDDVYDPRKRWKKMTEQYDTLFDHLNKASPVSIAIIREKKLYDECKSELREQKVLLAAALATNYDTKKIYKENESLEQDSKKWKKTETTEIIDEKETENGTHAHNCKICKTTCRSCSSKLCNVSVPASQAAMGAGLVAPQIGEGALAASRIGIVGATRALLWSGVGLAAAAVVYGVMKAVTAVKGALKCDKSECKHPNSDHVTEKIIKTKITDNNEIIDEDMKKIHEAAVNKKSDANIKLIEGEQKSLSIGKKLSEHTVRLLHHAKRIYDLNEDFNYMKDINCYLDEPPSKVHECGTLVEEIDKNIVQVLKEAVKQLDSCATEQVCDNQGLVDQMLSDVGEHMEAGQSQAASEESAAARLS